MAPHWPEEVDVFSVPHSRMKKLIRKYNSMVLTTDFRDELHLMSLLQNLHNVFCELKAHEHIENRFIMRELRSKLRAASISDPAVCNCHSDNRLTEMQDLVLDGYKWAKKPRRERQVYGRKLRMALEDFTQNFLPHMDMEEQVFQPMLMEYFTYDELRKLKLTVIRQHGISEYEEYCREKFVADACESEESVDEQQPAEEEMLCHFDRLPDESCLHIFSFLGPQNLGRVNQVSRRWANLSRDPSLWSRIYPVHWAMGDWTFQPTSLGKEDNEGWARGGTWQKEQLYFCADEDADVDESSGDTDGHTTDHTDSEEDRLKDILREAKLLTAIVKHVLPKVGSGVKECHLAFSRGISNNLVHKILKLCPNLELLDLRQTLVGDAAFREFGVSGRRSRLRHLDLSGCENITDLTLHSLVPQTSAAASCSGAVARPDPQDTTSTCSEMDKEEKEADSIDQLVDRAGGMGNEEVNSFSDANGESSLVKTGDRAARQLSVEEGGIESVKMPSCCGRSSQSEGAEAVSRLNCESECAESESSADVGNDWLSCQTGRSCCEQSPIASETPVVLSTNDSIPRDNERELREENENYLQGQHCNTGKGNEERVLTNGLCNDTCDECLTDKQLRGEVKEPRRDEGNPQSCDLSYVYLDMLIQSDEAGVTSDLSGLTLNSSPLVAPPSPPPRQTDLSLSEVETSLSPYILFCGEDPPTSTTVTGQDSCNTNASEGCCTECQSDSAADVSDDGASRARLSDTDATSRSVSEQPGAASNLEFLSLSGCFRVTSEGISALSEPPGMPQLRHLDLSGCVSVCGESLRSLVSTAPHLDHADLYYCDNLPGDPFPTTASGCKNRDCCSLYCCSNMAE